ncbi:MAG: pyridoxamine 5'-phosphate oxidase family protein [Thermoleophilaceae bacterium]|nr:pyridoxamine 5'-phosphate oxidase family protein [Thermoleophilaceae bacterium]
MASRRDQIVLSDDEIAAYFAEAKTLIVATNGPRGLPHVMPLWFVMRGTEPWGWTFAKSQKAKNLERDPRATVLIEDGISYEALRGVMIETEVELIHDQAQIRELAVELFTRYLNIEGEPPQGVLDMIDAQAPKRVVLHFKPVRYVSWDHSKLGGTY